MPGPGWFVTPQGMLDYLNEVNRYIDAIQVSVAAQTALVPVPVLASWARFLSDWKVFFAEHQGFTDRLSGSVADTTERYEKDATLWREKLGKIVSLETVVFDTTKKPGGPQPPTLGDASELMKWGAIAAGAIWLLRR